LRNRGKEEHAELASVATPGLAGWAWLASQPTAWKTALVAGKAMNVVPSALLPVPALRAWEKDRTLPEWRGGEFRKWWRKNERKTEL